MNNNVNITKNQMIEALGRSYSTIAYLLNITNSDVADCTGMDAARIYDIRGGKVKLIDSDILPLVASIDSVCDSDKKKRDAVTSVLNLYLDGSVKDCTSLTKLWFELKKGAGQNAAREVVNEDKKACFTARKEYISDAPKKAYVNENSTPRYSQEFELLLSRYILADDSFFASEMTNACLQRIAGMLKRNNKRIIVHKNILRRVQEIATNTVIPTVGAYRYNTYVAKRIVANIDFLLKEGLLSVLDTKSPYVTQAHLLSKIITDNPKLKFVLLTNREEIDNIADSLINSGFNIVSMRVNGNGMLQRWADYKKASNAVSDEAVKTETDSIEKNLRNYDNCTLEEMFNSLRESQISWAV